MAYATDFLVSLPSMTANFLFSDSNTHIIQRPQIREIIASDLVLMRAMSGILDLTRALGGTRGPLALDRAGARSGRRRGVARRPVR